MYYFKISQSSSADNWGGFVESNTKVSSPPTEKRSTKPISPPDFNAIDIKSQKPKSTTNKTKKIEDDAWDLLNN